jgi:hypothetical protein
MNSDATSGMPWQCCEKTVQNVMIIAEVFLSGQNFLTPFLL